MRRWIALLAVVVALWPMGADAQQATPTPMRVERDRLEDVLDDFLDPCTAVRGYMRDLGQSPLSPGVLNREVRDRAWDIMAAMLGFLAMNPTAAQDPVGLRAAMRGQIQRAFSGESVYYGREAQQQVADALESALSRWWAGEWGPENRDRDGLLIVAMVMSDPDRAAVYRASLRYAGVGEFTREILSGMPRQRCVGG